MATGKTLGHVLTKTLHEIGKSSQSALNIDARETLKSFIVDEQERLVDEYQWLSFVGDEDGRYFDIELVAGERYYDWPDNFDWKTLRGVAYLLNGTWVPVDYGITLQDYSAFNPENDERSEPTQKWDFHTEEQIEIWPLPSSNGGTVRLEGRGLPNMTVSEALVLSIDSIALQKFAAASYLRSKTDETGESRRLGDIRYAEGLGRIRTLKARRGKHQRISFTGGRMPDAMDPRFRIRVAS